MAKLTHNTLKDPDGPGTWRQGARAPAGAVPPPYPAGDRPSGKTHRMREIRKEIAWCETRLTQIQKRFEGFTENHLISVPCLEPIQIRGHRKERVGEVVSDKMSKTIVVRVERRFRHPQFKEGRHCLQQALRTR